MTDSLIDHKTKYSLTWAAIIIAIILLVPGFMIGSIVAFIYKWLLGSAFGVGGDRWIFFIEWIDEVVLFWFPTLLNGMIGGAFSIAITGIIFKSANMKIVSYSAFAIYISMVMITMSNSNFNGFHDGYDLASVIVETIGIVFGLFYFGVLANNGVDSNHIQ